MSRGRRAILLVGLAACAGAADAPPGDSPAERCRTWITQGLVMDSLSRPGLRAQLGTPETVTTATEPNRHIPDAIDSIFTLTWPGVEVRLRTPPSGEDLVERVTVRDNRWLRWAQPGIGTTADRVTELFGPPQERQPNVLRYACRGGPVDEPVGFVITGDTVSEIVFDFYVD